MTLALRLIGAGVALSALLAASSADARITRIEITRVEPAFGGAAFDQVGAYEHVVGRAHGELDPALPGNAIIQDLYLAPRNARGMVEYTTDIEILRPADQARGNRVLLFEVLNRGNKLALGAFNAGVSPLAPERNALTGPGDGHLMRQGYTVVWFGWQADVLPGLNRLTLDAPVARNPDGSPITGTVRTELTTLAPITTLNLSSGWFTVLNHRSYPTVSTDNRAALADGFLPTLTVRAREQDPRRPIANTEWSFGSCYRANQLAIIYGSSQSGRMIRSLIHLGFNQDERGARVFAGAYPHIGGGLMPLNVRFSQPGRAWGDQVDHLFPAYDFPFTYARVHDPITQRTQGILDRCSATDTCPRIFHVATALEIWEGRQSLGFTDPLGTLDVADPPNVRSFIFASTQHGAALLPLATTPPFGVCQQQPNPNPHLWTMRALLADFTAWVRDDAAPPPSTMPRIADGTLVPADQVRFPTIPANEYGGVPRPAVQRPRTYNPLHVVAYGPLYNAADTSGILAEPPRVSSATYNTLVLQVDADGNDIGGIRSLALQVPIGTYTGWNLGRAGRYEDGFCSLTGSFIPFARTRAERAAADPRPSLEERYPTRDAYVAAVRRAAESLVAQRFLLQDDATALVAEAERDGVRQGP